MAWTLCTSGNAILKGTVHVNSDITDYGANRTFIDQLSDEAEALACCHARYDVITNYASLTASGKAILAQFCEAVIGQNLISYDPDALGVAEATFSVNIMENQKVEAKTILEDKNAKLYLGITS